LTKFLLLGTLENKTISTSALSRTLNTFGYLIEIGHILYIAISAVVVLYNNSIFKYFQPRVGDTPMHEIVGNTTILLIMSSSLPIIVRILGLTSFDLMGYYSNTDFLRNSVVLHLYRLVFLSLVLIKLLELFKQRSFDQWIKHINPTSTNNNSLLLDKIE